jgi:hypothetical protein
MWFRLPKSVRSSCMIKPAVEFLIDVADTRFPNEMRHTWLVLQPDFVI